MKDKVVIISLHKTGTSSLAVFLENIGYLVTGPDTHLFVDAVSETYKKIDTYLKTYDAFQDDPWYMLFPYIKQKYPNTKFVYLEREETSWIKSVQAFYGANKYNNAVRRKFYGHANTLKFKDQYLKKYREHKKEVFQFFKYDPNFLVIQINKAEDAVKLQTFLGLQIKYTNFPYVNKTPKTSKERFNRKASNFFKGYFGLNKLIKRVLRSIFGYQQFVKIREDIRLFRTKMRVFRKKIIGH